MSNEIAPETVVRAFVCCVECFEIIPIEEDVFAAWKNQGVLLRDLRKDAEPTTPRKEGEELGGKP